MNIADITTKNWAISATEPGKVVQDLDDINQCISIILATAKGTDPLRPEFGCDILRWIDKPVNQAVPNIIKEAVASINLWEPRVVVTSASAKIENFHIFVSIQWETLSSSLISSTQVQYVRN